MLRWYCPDCHRLFAAAHAIRISDGRRFHNAEKCGSPLVWVHVREIE